MKKVQKSAVFSIAIMVIVIAAIGFFTLYAFVDKNTISENENRNLAKAPEVSVKSWFDGSLTNDLNSFLNDHVLMRNQIIDKASGFESLLRKELPIQLLKSNDTRKDIGSDALILSDRILALYIANQEYIDTFIRLSNKLYDQLPDNINKYMMISPSRIEFESDEVKQYTDNQYGAIYEIYTKMNNDVNTVDSYSLLRLAAQNIGIDRLYFKTDHHWTAYGASMGASALLASMGKSIVIPETYNEISTGEFHGYLAVMHMSDLANISKESFTYFDCADGIYEYAYGVEKADISEYIYEPVIDASRAGYYAFIERSYQYVVIEGGDSQGGTMLMINDSFGNAMVPWMASQFNKIIMIDPRLYEGGYEGFMRLVEDYEVTDFVISFAGLFMSSSYVGNLENLCK